MEAGGRFIFFLMALFVMFPTFGMLSRGPMGNWAYIIEVIIIIYLLKWLIKGK